LPWQDACWQRRVGMAKRDDAWAEQALITVSWRGQSHRVWLAAWEITCGFGGARVGDAATWPTAQLDVGLAATHGCRMTLKCNKNDDRFFTGSRTEARLGRWVRGKSLRSTVMHCHARHG
jgi:hypothetical protein